MPLNLAVFGANSAHAVIDAFPNITSWAIGGHSLGGTMAVDTNQHPKWLLYSGLFVLLKQKLRISQQEVDQVTQAAAGAFASLVYGNVRSFV